MISKGSSIISPSTDIILTPTSSDWKELAIKIIDAYTYYPMAMVDLLKVIAPYLNNNDTVEVDMLKTEALYKATKATSQESLQPNACKELANTLIGENKVDLASFSFDGDNAGKIILNSKYDDYEFQVQYSLDGGENWKATLEHQISLTSEEINSITAENDIKVKISGSNEVFTIDILEGENISKSTLDINDDEDRFMGKTNNLQYSLDGGNTWLDYTSETTFEGTMKVKVRYKAHGVYLAGGPSRSASRTMMTAQTRTHRFSWLRMALSGACIPPSSDASPARTTCSTQLS